MKKMRKFTCANLVHKQFIQLGKYNHASIQNEVKAQKAY